MTSTSSREPAFRLLRHFSVASFIAIAFASIALSVFYRHEAMNDLIRSTDHNNFVLTRAFGNIIWPWYGSLASAAPGLAPEELRSHPLNRRVDDTLRGMVRGTSIVKIRVYAPDGFTLYSSDPAQIGQNASDNPRLRSAVEGNVVSAFATRNDFVGLDRSYAKINVRATYAPLRRGDDGPVEAVFEIYDDLTPAIGAFAERQHTIVMGAISILSLLYAILFLVVRHADAVLERQARMRAEAEDELRAARDELESRVAARTAELDAANALLQEQVENRSRIAGALRDSESKFRSLTELSSDWYWEQDSAFRFVETRGETEQRAGITPEDHVGKTRWELPYTRPVGFTWEEHRRLLAGRAPFRNILLRRDAPGGPPRYISVSGKPFYNDKGEFSGYRGVASDVTAQKHAERELELARRGAEEASLAKSRFVANVSHEVRTPMSGLLGMADLLRDTPLTPLQRHYVETLQASGEALLGIVNDLLDLSKIEAGALKLEAVPYSPAAIAGEAVSMLATRASRKNLELTCQIGPGVPASVIGDPLRLRQVLANLTTNAVKFTDRGRVVVSVQCMTADGTGPGAQDSVSLHFAVADTGVGIPRHAQETLFQAFAQGNPPEGSRDEGAGLGLAICRQLVELMGGRITVESEAGAGSTFSFTLPARIAGSGTAIAAPEKPVTVALPSARPRLNVLLAEDNAVNEEIVVRALTAFGSQVDVVRNGIDAVLAAGTGRYDVIFMDCQMPDMDGFEATRRIRAVEAASRGSGARVPIIALTASAMASDREQCLAAGMNDYLAKPFRREQLVGMLVRWLPVPDAEPGSHASAEVALQGMRQDSEALDPAAVKELRMIERDGAKGFMADVIRCYSDVAPALLHDMKRAVETADAEALGRASHSLKSSSAQVGAVHASRLCRDIENAARAGRIPPAIATQLEQLDNALRAAIDALKAEAA